MSEKYKFELNLAGLNALMKSKEMVAVLDSVGDSVVHSAGEGYSKRTHQATWVAICNVFPNTEDAARDNYQNNSLLKALGNLPSSK